MVHYENLKEDLVGQMHILMKFLGLPAQDDISKASSRSMASRMDCLVKYKHGFFKRDAQASIKTNEKYNINPFPKHIRDEMDGIIDHVNNNVLKKYGYTEMPTSLYMYYKKVRISKLDV